MFLILYPIKDIDFTDGYYDMNSYKSIIKSTGLVGTVQLFKIVFGIIQNKVLALLLGASGFGIWGLFYSFSTTISPFCTFGIDQASVREISKNSDDRVHVSQTIWLVRVLVLIFTTIACVSIIIFRKEISVFIFGTTDNSQGIIFVSIAIIFTSLYQVNASIFNGLRDLKRLSISQITGIIFASVTAILFVVFMGIKGIPFFILISAIVNFLVSDFFLRKLKMKSIRPGYTFFKEESEILFKIGAGIAYSAIIVAASTYLIQIYIRKNLGIDIVGIYNASFTISNVYVGILLTAMGVDLMPRLAKLEGDRSALNQAVNEQTELGVLVSSIGVTGVILFAPIILRILYSSEFSIGVDIIRWQILGVALRVLSFPLTYCLLVRIKTIKYVIVQTVAWVGNYVFLILLVGTFGLEALGLNYFVAYLIYMFILYSFNRNDVRFSKKTMYVFCIAWLLILSTWLITRYIPQPYNYVGGTFVILVNIAWIIYYLNKSMNISIINEIRKRIQKK